MHTLFNDVCYHSCTHMLFAVIALDTHLLSSVLLSGVSAHDRRGRIFKEGKSMDDEHKIVEGMLRRNPSDNHTFVGLIPNEDEEPGGSDEGAEGGALFGSKAAKEAKLTAMGGMNTAQTVIAGDDNAVRMLKREGTKLIYFGILTSQP